MTVCRTWCNRRTKDTTWRRDLSGTKVKSLRHGRSRVDGLNLGVFLMVILTHVYLFRSISLSLSLVLSFLLYLIPFFSLFTLSLIDFLSLSFSFFCLYFSFSLALSLSLYHCVSKLWISDNSGNIGIPFSPLLLSPLFESPSPFNIMLPWIDNQKIWDIYLFHVPPQWYPNIHRYPRLSQHSIFSWNHI